MNGTRFAPLSRWAYARSVRLMLLLSLIGWIRLGIDELPHPRPTENDRRLAGENWYKLENAYSRNNHEAAQSLIGKPVLFFADVDNRGAQITGHGIGLIPGEKLPCHWKLTRMQQRRVSNCCSMGLEVYGTVRSVSSARIEIEPKDFGLMICL
jgi:hypothetical protein